jgi:anthranilate synthase component 1
MLSKNEFDALVEKGFNKIAICKTITLKNIVLATDLYANFANKKYSFIVESAHKDGVGNINLSVIGLPAKSNAFRVNKFDLVHTYNDKIIETITTKDPNKIFDKYLQGIKSYTPKNISQEKLGFAGGLVGYYGFESIAYSYKKLESGLFKKDHIGMDDIVLWECDEFLVFDRLNNQVTVVSYADVGDYEKKIEFINSLAKQIMECKRIPHMPKKDKQDRGFVDVGFDENGFKQVVNKSIEHIISGDVMQILPSQMIEMKFDNEDAIQLYKNLMRISPSPYMFIINTGDLQIVGASPELLARLSGDKMTVKPLAGTRVRGTNLAQDTENERDLITDTKELAEHLMLIDLARNDLGKIAKTGSVKVTEQMVIEKYSTVMHISSTVVATKLENKTSFDLLKSAHPAGTLSGAPKIKAIELLQQMEMVKRGVYGGFIGNISFDGDLNSCIAIRTGTIKDNKLYIQAGAGIVADSKPENEWQEVQNKRRALLAASRLV